MRTPKTGDPAHDAGVIEGEVMALGLVEKVIRMLITLVSAVALGLGSWALVTTVSLSERVGVIEANRYTVRDAKTDRESSQQRFDTLQISIQEELVALGLAVAKLPSEVPPQWFLDKVDRIELRLTEIEKMMRLNTGGVSYERDTLNMYGTDPAGSYQLRLVND